MKKRNKGILLIIAGLSIFFAVFAISDFKTSTIENDFVLYDTSNVTKIFIADKKNNSVLLTKKGGEWYLPENQAVLKENVDLILKTMLLIDIKHPVSKSALQSTIRRLSSDNNKVEIYQNEPLINFFGIKLFYREKLTKVFYVGGPTMDYQGTLMKMENSDEIYVTYLPGFNGYLSERFSSRIADWKSHEIFNYSISQISKVKIEFPENPKESYTIDNVENRSFVLTQLLGGITVSNYDTIRVLELLASFNKLNFETYLDDMTTSRIDSLKKSLPFKVVTLTTKLGENKVLKLYHRYNVDGMLDIDGKPFKYDMDRMYGIYTDIKVPVSIQFFTSDNITRTLSFLKGENVEMLNLGTNRTMK